MAIARARERISWKRWRSVAELREAERPPDVVAPLGATTRLARTRSLCASLLLEPSHTALTLPPSVNVSGNFYRETMIIDCENCVMKDIACKDCVVSVFIEAPRASSGSEIGAEESRVIDLLASRGMIPPLRYAHQEGNFSNSQDSEALSG